MTQPATSQLPTISQQMHDYSPANLLFGAAFTAGSTALAAGAFTAISPLGGAVFGVSSFLSGRLINWICDKVNCFPDSIVARVAQFALSTIGGIGAAVLVTTLVGFPMTMTSGVILAVASIAISVAAGLALASCLCSSAIATGIALGNSATPETPVRV